MNSTKWCRQTAFQAGAANERSPTDEVVCADTATEADVGDLRQGGLQVTVTVGIQTVETLNDKCGSPKSPRSANPFNYWPRAFLHVCYTDAAATKSCKLPITRKRYPVYASGSHVWVISIFNTRRLKITCSRHHTVTDNWNLRLKHIWTLSCELLEHVTEPY